jgi:hypothetical protein
MNQDMPLKLKHQVENCAPGCPHVRWHLVLCNVPEWLKDFPVFIEQKTYERFVQWSAKSMAASGVHLDEALRLDQLLQACVYAVCAQGGCFVLRALDALDPVANSKREIFSLECEIYNQHRKAWLIKHIDC